MTLRTIRDVDTDTWKQMRELAWKRKMKMAILLKMMVKDFSKNKVRSIIPEKPILTKDEAEGIEETLKNLRKEHGFR